VAILAGGPVNVPNTPAPEAPEPWVVSQEPNGAWSAVINLHGEWIPLGYFGAREDAEETIAACLQPPTKAPPPTVS
jgi:hypothetical protein